MGVVHYTMNIQYRILRKEDVAPFVKVCATIPAVGGYLSFIESCFNVSRLCVVALLRVNLPPPLPTSPGWCTSSNIALGCKYLHPPSDYPRREAYLSPVCLLPPYQAVKNLLNWTHPPKTLLVYAVVALAWLVLLVVPGRYIVLTLGLLEFSKAWMTGGQEPELVADDSGGTPSPLAIKLRNLLLR